MSNKPISGVEFGGRFPIHPTDRHILASVPWSLVEPHRAQALRNHSQSLETLASRGGLGLAELYYVLRDSEISWPPAHADFCLNYINTRIDLARAALAKARGESPDAK
jgi:hypothetical protein